jgi:hypothetical protein
MELESHGLCDANNAVFTSADAAPSGVLLRKFGAGMAARGSKETCTRHVRVTHEPASRARRSAQRHVNGAQLVSDEIDLRSSMPVCS